MTDRLRTPPKITLGITEACPLRCQYCYADCAAAPKPGELSADRWINLLDQVIGDGVIQVYIEGGEPLAKPGILRIVARSARDAMTLLRTHGTLVDDATADALKDAGVGRILVDLMGSEAAVHDEVSGVPGSFDQACRGIRRLVARGIPTDVLVVLTRRSAPTINVLLRLAADLGVRRVGVLRLYPLGRARRNWDDLALSLDEQMRTIRGLDPPPGLEIMQSWHPHNKNCCWQAAAVNAFGRAIGCMYLREYVDFGDAGSVRYVDLWSQNPLYRQLRASGAKQNHELPAASDGTRGGCRSTAYAFHGRWDAPDPFDEALNHGTDLRSLPQ
jgi:MoaA/NifB/PqqE/SkfB family radical SAM enzyme